MIGISFAWIGILGNFDGVLRMDINSV